MVVVLLVAGIGLFLAGLLAIGFGIPIKDFSVGNQLILTGVMGICTGTILIAFWMAIRELKIIARRLGAGVPEPRGEITVRAVLPPGVARNAAAGEGGSPLVPAPEQAGDGEPAMPSPPWQDEATSRGDAPAGELAAAEAAAPAPKPKRNLLFSSTSRKERERAQARTSEPLTPDLLSADIRPNPPAAPPEPAEPPPASFDDAWPKPERSRPGEIPPQRRGGRSPSTFEEANGAPPRIEEQPAVTVLKSGVVDGMAYSLYSDGSIEAQMPEGMMRFASIDDLRAHLDQRP